MKKILVLLAFLLFIPTINAKEIDLYFFYSETCTHCQAEKEWLDETYGQDEDINIIMLESVNNKENSTLLENVLDNLKINSVLVPSTIIGTTGIQGFGETQKNQITKAIEKYQSEEYVDIVDVTKNNLDVSYEINPPEGEFILPFVGTINPKDISLPLVAATIGFIDGFNPCAMWVLIFLISMLFNMKNRKKMWIIGVTFLTSSAIIYLLAMLSVLQISIFFQSSNIFRIAIGLFALIGAYINLSSYIKERKEADGCKIVDDKKRKTLLKKMKNIISTIDDDKPIFKDKKFITTLIAIIGLAASVNIVELACTSGLPAIFTQILALNDLTFMQSLMYSLIYMFFFLIDDLLVFFIAMTTLKISGISTKYNKLSHLIGGIIMVLIGILMIFKPEWIMFNFV